MMEISFHVECTMALTQRQRRRRRARIIELVEYQAIWRMMLLREQARALLAYCGTLH